MLRIVTVLGARPQFVKAAVVSRALRQTGAVEEILVHTGQHYDENMSQRFFDELEIPTPRYRLQIGSGSHGSQTGRMLEAVEAVLHETKPAVLLVYGDTNSTLAGALAAAKLHIRVAHVEAGLRSFNRRMPEEINRVLTDHLAKWLFAPTTAAAGHLRAEGIAPASIHIVGDVMYDASLHFADRARARLIDDGTLSPRQYILATIHRAENTDDVGRLTALLDGLAAVAPHVPIVLPLHPRTRGVLERQGRLETYRKRLGLCEPVGYLEMLALEKNARLIVTDSGGVQKEAFFHRVPCLTVREETEWTELVDIGWNRLAPFADAAALSRSIHDALNTRVPDHPPEDLYGGGTAATRVAEILLAHVSGCLERPAVA